MADEEQHTGVGVFLLPEASDQVVAASSEPAHLTTVWLGDMNDLDEDTIGAIRDEVAAYSAVLEGPVVVPVAERGTLGDEDADVIFLEGTEALLALREGLLEASPTIKRVMEGVEQFPEWTPHVTLGYPETPAAGEYDGDTVTFDRVGLWVGPDQEEFPMSGKSDSELTQAREKLASLTADASPDPVDDQSDLTESEEVGIDDEMPFDELEEGEELVTEVPVHGVATLEGKPTGDGRGFRQGAISFGRLPAPLGYEFESSHGGDNSRVAVVGRIDEFFTVPAPGEPEGVFEVRWRGAIMPGKPYGALAIESIIDGSYDGVSVIVDSVEVDVEEEREAVRARILAERAEQSALETQEIPAAITDEELDVEEIVDLMVGDGVQPVTWFSAARVRRFDMVPTGAYQEGYTALGHEFADELTEEQLTAAAQALEDCGCAQEVLPEDVADLPTGQYVVEYSDESGTGLYGPFASREEASAWIGSAGDGEYEPIPVSQALVAAGVFRDVSDEERKKLADEGKALPDGSFPIANVEDLRNAIQAIGRASDPEAAKNLIKKRAKELGQEDLIPEDWAALLTSFAPGTKDGPGWITHPVPTARIRRYWVRGKGAAKIKWGVPGDFNRCRAQLAKYVQNPEWLAGLCANMHKEAIGVWPGQEGGGRHSLVASGTPAPLAVMASATTVTERAVYPASAFRAPQEGRAFGLRIDREARTVSGYVAQWGSCHIGITGTCQEVPSSPSDYSFFRKGVVDTDEGEQRVGLITAGIGHAGDRVSAAMATAHYDRTDAVRAYINIGEDEHGIWYAGVLAPWTTDADIDELRAIGRVSGDWRNWSGVRGELEMVGLVAVNTEGFQLAASGGVQTAAIGLGALPREDEPAEEVAASAEVVEFDVEGFAEQVADRVVEIQERRALAAQTAPARAALASHRLASARAELAKITKE